MFSFSSFGLARAQVAEKIIISFKSINGNVTFLRPGLSVGRSVINFFKQEVTFLAPIGALVAIKPYSGSKEIVETGFDFEIFLKVE